jgi:hypothetical protein
MKTYLTPLLCCVALSCCSNNTSNNNVDTAQERLEEERKGSVFGKDALTWKWSKNADEKTVTAGDPLWSATTHIMNEYPITFKNFHARLIQTDWITSANKESIRYRFTIRLLGKSPKAEHLDVLMIMERKLNNTWIPATPDMSIRKTLTDRIVMEAIKIYDQNKRD